MRWSAVAIVGLAMLSVLYLTLAAFVWRHRDVVASRPLIAMLLATKFWTVCYAMELSSRSVAAADLWSALKFVGVVSLPPALWNFVRQYSGKGPLSRRTLGLLLIQPAIMLGLLAFPDTRRWIHVYHDRTLLGAPYPDAGWAYWGFAVYIYVLMMSAVIALLFAMTRVARQYRRQASVLVVASVLPMVANLLWALGLLGDIIDPTPPVFGLTAVVLVWGFFRLRLLDLVPVARGVVVEQMTDAVMVLDVYGRVADANPAATRILGGPRSSLIGRAAADLLPGLGAVLAGRRRGDVTVETELVVHPEPPAPHRAVADGVGDHLPQAREDVESLRVSVSTPPQMERPEPAPDAGEIAVTVSGVTDSLGREIACIVVMRDVSERNRTERRVRTLLAEQTRLSDVLRQSLLPAALPDIAGVRLAARFLPASGGAVGGDFYDVHPTDDGRWAFVLGDVSGKGAQAAVVTSTARYAVRTLSAQGWRPREVLEQLNRVLVSPEDPERFCTVVYGQIDPQPDPAGVRLVLSLGGHPPPLVRRRDGTVQQVGVPGTVLGIQAEVRLDEVSLHLSVGDVLLAYTDGVTEARSAGKLFGEDGLARVLSRLPVAAESAPVEAVADDVAGAVLDALSGYAPARDDVALLAMAVTG